MIPARRPAGTRPRLPASPGRAGQQHSAVDHGRPVRQPGETSAVVRVGAAGGADVPGRVAGGHGGALRARGQVGTVREIYAEMTKRGTGYAESTVFKTTRA